MVEARERCDSPERALERSTEESGFPQVGLSGWRPRKQQPRDACPGPQRARACKKGGTAGSGAARPFDSATMVESSPMRHVADVSRREQATMSDASKVIIDPVDAVLPE